jgi:transposase
MDKYIGFDVDSKKTVACVVQKGKKDVYQTLPSEPQVLADWLNKQRKGKAKLHLTFEISGQAGWMYDRLIDTVDSLAVSNPSKMTWIYRTAKKTDRIDARKQAVLLQMGEIPKVHMPERAVRQWRCQIQHRRKLVNSQTQVKNRIRAYLKGTGLSKLPFKWKWWTQKSLLWLGEFGQEDGILQDMLEQLELLRRQIKRATLRLDERLRHHKAGELLQTIAGVGPRTTEAVLAYTDEVARFARGKQYCSYFGLTPKLDESGSFRRLGHISKQGPSVVRWLIVESAWRAIKKSPALRAFYERVRHGQDKRKKIAIVATARKMLSVMRAMLQTGEVFNEQLVLRQEQLPASRESWLGRRKEFYGV